MVNKASKTPKSTHVAASRHNTSKSTAHQRKSVSSAKIHRTKSRTFFLRPRTLTQKIIIAVISIALLSVVAACLCGWLFKPERTVKSQINALATNYYESYFYPQIAKNTSDIDGTLQAYTDTGFSEVSLLQLMAADPTATTNTFTLTLKYCDSDATTVTFYPDPPYTKTSYRAEFHYSCSF